MANLIKWRPLNELLKEFFDYKAPFADRKDVNIIPPIDIKNTDNEFVIKVDLPGLKKEEVDLSVEEGTLCISGSKTGESRTQENGYVHLERSFGTFSRRIRLPENVSEDTINADFMNGTLTISAKKDGEEKPRVKKININ